MWAWASSNQMRKAICTPKHGTVRRDYHHYFFIDYIRGLLPFFYINAYSNCLVRLLLLIWSIFWDLWSIIKLLLK